MFDGEKKNTKYFLIVGFKGALVCAHETELEIKIET
jgi:hypothetical protein